MLSASKGAFQQAIRAGLRGLDLVKNEPQTPAVVSTRVTLYSNLGRSFRLVGEAKEAQRYLSEGLEMVRPLGTPRSLGWSAMFLRDLAFLSLYQEGREAEVLEYGQESVRTLEVILDQARRMPEGRRQNFRIQLAHAVLLVGQTQLRMGRLQEAEASFNRALTQARTFNLSGVAPAAVSGLGRIALVRKRYGQALNYFNHALAVLTRVDAVPVMISSTS